MLLKHAFNPGNVSRASMLYNFNRDQERLSIKLPLKNDINFAITAGDPISKELRLGDRHIGVCKVLPNKEDNSLKSS